HGAATGWRVDGQCLRAAALGSKNPFEINVLRRQRRSTLGFCGSQVPHQDGLGADVLTRQERRFALRQFLEVDASKQQSVENTCTISA
ncbi:hypothetical protein, partial [Mesorhizobium sp. M2A.F.Ca.ET.067.02.1.1]|uniref:hypothetical protein n=1 Tax=Mesorhizobium sp. M2A.F.Ca.ET.067.02.1.1 TaxID=2496749 RepID=UPI001AECE47C